MQLPGEALVIKMWETLTEKGIGSLLRPWSIRRDGRASTDARREEMLVLAQTELDIEAIRRGEKELDKEGNLVSVPLLSHQEQEVISAQLEAPPLMKLLENITHQKMADVLHDEVTISKILLHAEEELLKGGGEEPVKVTILKMLVHAEQELLKGGDEEPKEYVADDWLRRWRDSAKDISSDDLQQLWGKILAGEFRNPGTYSLRTLEFVKSLTQGEAEAIASIGPYTMGCFGVIFNEPNGFMEDKGIDSRKLVELQELGILLNAQPYPYWVSTNESGRFCNVLLVGSKVIFITSPVTSQELTFSAFCLTKLGKEMLSLGQFDADEDYVLHVARCIKAKGFNVQVGRWWAFGREARMFDLGEISMFDLKDV